VTNRAAALMENKDTRDSYSFELPDWEDSLRSTRGPAWRDGKKRVHVDGLWYSLVFPLILVATLFIVLRAVSDPKETVLVVIAAIFVAWAGYGSFRLIRPKDVLPPFFQALGEVADVFVIDKGKSFGALMSAPLVLFFVVLERVFPRRYVPLGAIVRITLASALVSVFIAYQWGLCIFNFCPFLDPLIKSSLTDLLRQQASNSILSRLGLLTKYSAAWLFWIYSQILLLALILCFINWLRSRRLDLKAAPLPSNIRHLSDLHITANDEDPIAAKAKPVEDVIASLIEQTQHTDVLLISGDITDGGQRGEWKAFLTACKKIPASTVLVMCPGNHDLHTYTGKYLPFLTSITMPSCLPRLRKIRYLTVASELCQKASIMGKTGAVSLAAYMAQHAAGLARYAYEQDSDLAKTVDEIWAASFPMFWETDDATFVALDTNRVPSNFLTSGLGDISRDQLNRLERIIADLPAGKKLIIVGHHHLYTPPAPSIRREMQMKYLQSLKSNELTQLLSQHDCHYMHGHRHVAFSFSIGKVSVASAPSSRYEDVG